MGKAGLPTASSTQYACGFYLTFTPRVSGEASTTIHLESALMTTYPGDYGQVTLRVLVNAMKLFSVGAHCYPIGHLSWTDYTPRESADDPPSYKTTLYGEPVKLTPLPIAIPATISYLGIAETLEKKNERSVIGKNLGDTEWNRVFGLIGNDLSKVHTMGSLEGVWEGAFTVSHIRIHTSPVRFTHAT